MEDKFTQAEHVDHGYEQGGTVFCDASAHLKSTYENTLYAPRGIRALGRNAQK